MNCGEVTPRRRHSGDESRIPVPSSPNLRRSGSQRFGSFSPIAEHSRNGSLPSRSPLLNRHRSLVVIFINTIIIISHFSYFSVAAQIKIF